MITLDAYRVSVGCFCPRLLSTTCFIKRAYRGFYNELLLMNRFYSIYRFLKQVCVREAGLDKKINWGTPYSCCTELIPWKSICS